ncbi:ATP-binding cassette (ABC) Superfamily [Phytophthora palmivora]|uniref:ATP-binding cassette (ABC) Superfamily n=1 Tax=Phytophthora palmivora TaxID=4796 RepID=A0A2P4YIW7_9STRA|nr:ATP-binding cassette (ABC) Superfamily [Phytophthora palmivora]
MTKFLLTFANKLNELQLLAARLARQPVRWEHNHAKRWVPTHAPGYFPPNEGHGSLLFLEQLMGPRPLAGDHTSIGAYERHLINDVPLFLENIDVANSVHLSPRRIPLKEFTRLRKKSETKGSVGIPLDAAGEYLLSCSGELGFSQGFPNQGVKAQLEFILIQRDLGPTRSFLKDEVRQPCDRIYAIEIELDIGFGGLAATQSGKPTALDVLRQGVDAPGRETREIHWRVNRRVSAFTLKELRRCLDALNYEANDHIPSDEPQGYSFHSAYGLALNGAHTRGARSLLIFFRPLRGEIPRTIVPFKTPHEVDGIGGAVPAEDPNGTNEVILQVVTPNGANQR